MANYGDKYYGNQPDPNRVRQPNVHGHPVHQTDAYGNPVRLRQTDAYGNPVRLRQTDEYGNPVHHTGTMGHYGTTGATGAYGTGTRATGTTGAYPVRQPNVHGDPVLETDAYGNPVHLRQTDEYGNPVHYTGTMGDYGTTGATGAYGTSTGATSTTAAYPVRQPNVHGDLVLETDAYGNPVCLRQTDEYGNPVHHTRGKKGFMEKIKEKLCGHHDHYEDHNHYY
ncbi:dehydrin DHN1-like [Cornus florida]|uniref:dehydrin DHN1-like n=1 Tax=Cornus florida TaxID=4283 RepID=UPI0028A0575F|nr:dehydrin DHN1-like [Cornus florida]